MCSEQRGNAKDSDGTGRNTATEQAERKAADTVIAALAARYGNRLVTSQAVREQHGHTTTWIENQPPDAVVFPQATEEVQEIVRLCAAHRVPVIAFGTGTSLEGQVNAPRGGICLDFRDMNRLLAVHAEDLDCVIEPGITRKALNEQLRDRACSSRSIPAPTLRSAAWRRPALRAPMRCATAP